MTTFFGQTNELRVRLYFMQRNEQLSVYLAPPCQLPLQGEQLLANSVRRREMSGEVTPSAFVYDYRLSEAVEDIGAKLEGAIH